MLGNVIQYCLNKPNSETMMQKFPASTNAAQFFLNPLPPLILRLNLFDSQSNLSLSQEHFDNLRQFLENSRLTPLTQAFSALPFFFVHRLLSNIAINSMIALVNLINNRSKFESYLKNAGTFFEPLTSSFLSFTILGLLNIIGTYLILNNTTFNLYIGKFPFDAVAYEIFLLASTNLLTGASYYCYEKFSGHIVTLTSRNFSKVQDSFLNKKINRKQSNQLKSFYNFIKVSRNFMANSEFWSNLHYKVKNVRLGTEFISKMPLKDLLNATVFKYLSTQAVFLLHTYLSANQDTYIQNGIVVVCETKGIHNQVYLKSVFSTNDTPLLSSLLALQFSCLLYSLTSLAADYIFSIPFSNHESSNQSNYPTSTKFTLRGIFKSYVNYLRLGNESLIQPREDKIRQSYPLSEEQAATHLSESQPSLKRRNKGKEKAVTSSDEDSSSPSPSARSSYVQSSIATGIKFQIAHLDYREFFHIESLSTGNMMAFGIVLNKNMRIADQYNEALANCTSRTVIRIHEDGYSSKLYRTKNSDDRLLGYSGKTALGQLEKFAFKGVSIDDSLQELTKFAERYGKTNIEIHTFNDVYSHSK